MSSIINKLRTHTSALRSFFSWNTRAECYRLQANHEEILGRLYRSEHMADEYMAAMYRTQKRNNDLKEEIADYRYRADALKCAVTQSAILSKADSKNVMLYRNMVQSITKTDPLVPTAKKKAKAKPVKKQRVTK